MRPWGWLLWWNGQTAGLSSGAARDARKISSGGEGELGLLTVENDLGLLIVGQAAIVPGWCSRGLTFVVRVVIRRPGWGPKGLLPCAQ